jgi:WD40 repeat protein
MPRLRFVNAPAARLHMRWTASVSDYVTALTWSPDGSRLAVATGEGPIHMMDAVTGAPCGRFDGDGVGTLDVAWCPNQDSPWLASAGQDGMIRIWDGRAGRLEGEMPGGRAVGRAIGLESRRHAPRRGRGAYPAAG